MERVRRRSLLDRKQGGRGLDAVCHVVCGRHVGLRKGAAHGVAIDDGTLSISVLRRAAQRDMGFVIARLLSGRLRATDHRQIDHVEGVTEGTIVSLSKAEDGGERGFPVQLDGDYIGDHARLELGLDPGALTVVA